MPTHVAELLDELKSRFGTEPTDGIQLLTVDALRERPFDPGMAVLVLPRDEPSLGDRPALPGRTAHGSDAAMLLRSLYPAEHPVRGLDGAADSTVGAID